ncbi:MAG TPA: hypothetical protein VGO87_05700 [Acidimicrobiia bacterium]|jgi:hypothetical protein
MSPTPARDGSGSKSRAALLWLRLRWDRAAEGVFLAAAAVVLLLTYRSVSHTPFVADQLSYLASGGVAGLCLLAVGLRLRITGDLRDEWHKLDRIEAALHQAAAMGSDGPLLVLPEDPPAGGAPSEPAGGATLQSAGGAPEEPAGTGRNNEPRERVGSQRGSAVLAVAVLMGLALFGLGWWRAAHAGTVSSAFTGFALAAVAGVLLIAGFCAPAVSLRRRLGRRQARLLSPFLTGGPPAPAVAVPCGTGDVVLVAPGLTRYHRDGCPATAGLSVTPTDRRRAASTLQPCEICAAG